MLLFGEEEKIVQGMFMTIGTEETYIEKPALDIERIKKNRYTQWLYIL